MTSQSEPISPADYDGMSWLVHDLRNYIQIATSAVTIMSRHADVVASARLGSIVSQAADSLERASDIVRHSSGAGATAEDVGLDQCLTEMSSLLRYACGPRIRVKLLVGLVPHVHCNRIGLQNAVLNLALNARDAMPGGGTITISALLAEGPETPEVELVVADTGHGMPGPVLERAFDAHFTTKPAGIGHGMGLYRVRRFAERFGGRATIASRVGVGTSVTLRLPAA